MNEKTEGRLAHAASPYLRSAVHQPVEWYEWGAEAFDRAKAEDKPILLDIGAVWCHWCHVIDRESYENPELAAVINRLFIPVKVDRDERPDVDTRYQAAISTISGQGGWPLTGFLLPDGRPFYGGTYFPPDDAMGRPGFRRILEAVAASYQNKRADVEEAAAKIAEAVANAETFTGARGTCDWRIVEDQAESIMEVFDSRNGGFGRSPKFPHPAAIDLLLELYQASGETRTLQVAATTLEKMGEGGVYDHLGGGFHRYSVDERWCVPHFEKMSYDNSELLKNFLHGYQVTHGPALLDVAEGIIDWTNTVLSDQVHGGFYASQDADQTLDDDGDYFTWTLNEVRAALTPEESRVAELRYDVEAHGEMHHNPSKNVLWTARSIAQMSQTIGGVDMAHVRRILASAKAKLLAVRNLRSAPFIDKTIYVAWNAMFVSAYLEAAPLLQKDRGACCRAFALKTLDRILEEAMNETGALAHRVGGARLAGSLDDQVFTGIALLDAYEATLDRKYFEAARSATDFTISEYYDNEGGGFFDRASSAPPMGGLEVRRKPLQDSPTPGANSVAAVLMDRLFDYTGDARYRACAEGTLEAFAGIAPRFGLHAASYGLAVLLHTRHSFQVVVTGNAGDPESASLEKAAHSVYRFGKAVLRVTPEQIASGALAPALAYTLPHLRADIAQALVCVGTSCRPPVTDPSSLIALLTQKPVILAAE